MEAARKYPKAKLKIERDIDAILKANNEIIERAERGMDRADKFLAEHRERMRDIHSEGL